MYIYYINVDSATDRRQRIEDNLKAFANPDSTVLRVPAYDTRYVEEKQIKGSLRPGEKGCFLSHIKAIEASLDDSGPSLILEDDAIFGTQTANLLDHFNSEANAVDILFTDLCVPNATWMLRLFQLRRTMPNKVATLATSQIDFAGSAAYVLNAKSKIKLLDTLKLFDTLDVPYDLVLKNLILQGALSSSFVFPFITSLSPAASASQIQHASDSHQSLWNAFRKLMFLESDAFFPDLLQEIEAIPADSDRDVQAFSALWKPLLSERFSDVLV